jgi:hypothetical protein
MAAVIVLGMAAVAPAQQQEVAQSRAPSAQRPAAADQDYEARHPHHMMEMCREMMGREGMMGGMMGGGMMGGMPMMGGPADSPRMMQMRGEMMKAMGEIMLKYGKLMETTK